MMAISRNWCYKYAIDDSFAGDDVYSLLLRDYNRDELLDWYMYGFYSEETEASKNSTTGEIRYAYARSIHYFVSYKDGK